MLRHDLLAKSARRRQAAGVWQRLHELLFARLTGANVLDVTQLETVVDAIQADRGYRSHRNRINIWIRNIEPIISDQDAPHGSGLGVTRWVIERTIAWLHQFRRLRIHYERISDIQQVFLSLGCILICFGKLKLLLC